MASGIFDKMFSFFHLGSIRKREYLSTSSSTGINCRGNVPALDPPPPPSIEGYTRRDCTKLDLLSDPKYSSCTVPKDVSIPQDTPPAYSDCLSDNTQEAIKNDYPDEHIQICPHEFLSFERRQRLTYLPRFRYNAAKIDALRPDYEFHHRGHDSKTKECQDSCKPLGTMEDPSFVGSLKGFGTYSYHAPNPGHAGGLALSFHWEMECLDPKQVNYRTTTELQQFFQTTGISLCPHTMLSDMDIVNMVHPVINRYGKPADPIYRYLAKEGMKDCTICPTQIRVRLTTDGKQGRTCRVDSKRWFGEGSGRDEQWRSQCVKQS